MKRWLRIPISPVFWIAAVQTAWTVTLVLWIVYFVDRSSRLPQEGWGILVMGILLLVLMNLGVTIILVHFGRQVAHNRAMKDFVSRVSHDLRSPLATVKLHIETLQMRALAVEQQQACLVMALQELAKLEAGIEDVLMAARVDRRSIRIAAETIDLRDFLRDYATTKQKEIGLHGNAVLDWIGAGSRRFFVRADPILLRQMVDNLVDNALVHCEPGVRIRLDLGEQGGCAVIVVVDDGPGLEPAERKRVFRMFYRTARSRRYKGTGLGLFIVAGIAEAHRGRAWVDSEGPGRGCIFRVALPLSGPPESA